MSLPSGSQSLAERLEAWRRVGLPDLLQRLRERSQAMSNYLASSSAESATHSHGWLRPKGNLTRGELGFLLAVAVIPLVVMVIRISALPGVLGPSLSGSLFPSLGHDLNELLSLHEIPAGDRRRVLYLLFLPTGAMLIAITRLTFGIRVIGFRSILIAVGFQQSGVVPSLILIAVMVALVVLIRPTLVRIRLPYYARVSVIMCISVVVLVGALLLAPWSRSEVLWRVGFFPVIVLGLLAEGIAKTLDRDSGLTAMFRTGMTIGVALLLAGVGQLPLLREIAIRFPELIITQIVSILLISEFLDLRLLQDWDARLSGVALPRLLSEDHRLRIAIVRNQRKNGIIARLGASGGRGYDRRTVTRIRTALREAGHNVKAFEGDITLLSKLRDFLPPHPRTGQPGGIVLNLAQGIQGDAPELHVPAMLEMAGVAYTGATPQGRLVTTDRPMMAARLEQAGLRTPPVTTGDAADRLHSELRFPIVVAARNASGDEGTVVKHLPQLDEAIRRIEKSGQRQAVLTPYIAGREIQVALVGNESFESLPLVEVRIESGERACPAALDEETSRTIRAAAIAAFHACDCRDYALVRLRFTSDGRLHVIDLSELGVLDKGGAFELAAEASGQSYAWLIDRIVGVARERYALPTAQSSAVPIGMARPERLNTAGSTVIG